ncbi:NTP transferase domain-containing protein [Helicobacter saguini]|uniref:NTP transferase domain-containing protein n=1 Tax=Helicobacter saguini TaxID=1548018 RepID=A0A347VPV1_9HELI|nr:NTP transferase domain-containing protein [Helicobacter saguini]MWV61200.1 NTP transferase domain-containing protein [Helicobacter saguini]MWV68133.1 NTP transferase domain-containing protein [Helicobacter saguini]MWV70403.1 NTP transferase domain-containing protein [Helicobacter saguini]MWV72305.1 NTP transferase domain-containing protein [Helicobacter saguini]TLD95342.1 hypothetical protein LS64_003105 [Helicobacter saguini]
MSSVKSVVISCAGIGSRLGLAKTKALINIKGKSLIAWQLESLQDMQDIRIVVGYQAKDVIDEVSKIRKDVIFVYNHNYFDTKTAASYYLGAKDGNEYAIELDGDLLVHRDDMAMLLKQDGEWIAYANKQSSDGILCDINAKGEVISFGNKNAPFEWTGPCCLRKDRIKFLTSNVYNQLESYLPMRGIKIRACDIDTYEDYAKALEFIKEW